jgi:AcrR family transcriptional regulator
LEEPETRALRADATRNRDQLLKAASRVFVSAATEPSMRAIAREAGVGIATLYRHFPTRESLVEAVYRDQVAGLTAGARELRADITAEDIAASLIGIFTVARPPEHDARASRLLNILMDGLRPAS